MGCMKSKPPPPPPPQPRRPSQTQANRKKSLAELYGDSDIRSCSKEMNMYWDLGSYDPEDVAVTAESTMVTVIAKQELSSEDDHSRKRASKETKRSFKLPKGFDYRSVTAAMNTTTGILNIKILKRESIVGREIPIPVTFKN